ncbi:NAD-dependent epimerase/dehydratase family protein [Phenylobacterium sp.]|uniref:NAD-dependent epimerase/dehydratase family protein n=1 Tax=Phenylobacterium sp. TaxID=1871053 RepID=UPI002810C21C|nr:NAD-dependent epimerase/dehydratase family protein [Phenylobacterium sp.]
MDWGRRKLVQLAVAAPALSLAPSALGQARKPLRILILGGTGFVGPHQVRYALARGHKVTLFNRGRNPKDWPAEVEELTGDRNTGDLKSLADREWDVCIDNPTTLPFWVRDAGAALKGRVKHYVFVSTISVYASNGRAADESDALAAYEGKDPLAETAETLRASGGRLYGPLKAASEAEARRQFGDANVTIVRPGLICGPGDETDRFTYWPVRLARGGEVLAPGDGSDPVQFIDVRDLAEWMIRLCEARSTGTFNASGPAAFMNMRTMLDEVGRAVRSDAKLTWAPADFLAAEGVRPWSDMPVWIPAEGENVGFHRRDISSALKAGLTHRPLATTAADTLAWFRSLPAERQGKMRAGLTPERESALLAKLESGG